MKKLKIACAMWFIVAIVSKLESRVVNGDPTNISLAANVIYIGTTAQDRAAIGENNEATVDVNLTGVSTIAGLRSAIATAARAWATLHDFTVEANNVLTHQYQAS